MSSFSGTGLPRQTYNERPVLDRTVLSLRTRIARDDAHGAAASPHREHAAGSFPLLWLFGLTAAALALWIVFLTHRETVNAVRMIVLERHEER